MMMRYATRMQQQRKIPQKTKLSIDQLHTFNEK